MQILCVNSFYTSKRFIYQYKLNTPVFNGNIKSSVAKDTPKKTFPAYTFLDTSYTTVPEIDYEEYIADFKNNPTKLKRMRWKYENYDKLVARPENLPDQKYKRLPLQTEKDMNDFIEISKIYNKYNDSPIICLGRSPKWFLNTSLWMKDGIPDYKFVAFSGYWYRPDPIEGVVLLKNGVLREDVLEEYYRVFSKTDVDSNAEEEIIKEQLTLAAGKSVNSLMIDTYKNYLILTERAYGIDKKKVLKELLTPQSVLPTPKEIEKYRSYLKRIKTDPETIVDNMKKTGKKTVITDYICTGKGFTSFLDIMGHYARDKGILENFSKSIEIVGIGSLDYMAHLDPYTEEFSEPSVIMPPVLSEYSNNIHQSFYKIDNYSVFEGMLLNQNTNECRSTYYPHWAWTLYYPDQFKTGIVKDRTKLRRMASKISYDSKNCFSAFSSEMRDWRNLLNFRILDGLNVRGLLKEVHKSKI